MGRRRAGRNQREKRDWLFGAAERRAAKDDDENGGDDEPQRREGRVEVHRGAGQERGEHDDGDAQNCERLPCARHRVYFIRVRGGEGGGTE